MKKLTHPVDQFEWSKYNSSLAAQLNEPGKVLRVLLRASDWSTDNQLENTLPSIRLSTD